MTEETGYEPRGAWFGAIRQLEKAAKEATTVTVPEDDSADFCGHLNAASAKLARHKRTIMAEVDGTNTGKEYEIFQSRTTDRTYNFDRILQDVIKAEGCSAIGAIRELVSRGALKVEFGWTALEAYYTARHIPMVVQKGNPIDGGDLEGPHVGETVKVKPKLGARKDK